jgi:hypothetical protein
MVFQAVITIMTDPQEAQFPPPHKKSKALCYNRKKQYGRPKGSTHTQSMQTWKKSPSTQGCHSEDSSAWKLSQIKMFLPG